jgi:hypothetical protein
VQQNKLFAEDGERYDRFGDAVYFNATTTIISATGNSNYGVNSGSAYIFKSVVNTSNLPILSVTPPFFEVSSSPTTASINIHNNYPASTMNWSAYSLDPWLQFIGDSTGTNSGTITVNVDENLYCPRIGRIIVRAPGALRSPREVFIYQEAGPNANEVNITPVDLDDHDFFGRSVDIDGEYAIVGAYGDDEYGSNAGIAYIFEREGCCSWIQSAKLSISDHNEGDYFGWSVAISGDVAIVSAPNDIFNREIYLYQKPISGWQNMTESARLTLSGIVLDHNGFGRTLDISGDFVVTSSPQASPPYVVFYQKPSGGWQDMTETYLFQKSNVSDFGQSVNISSPYAVIGSPHEDQSKGCVYIYRFDEWSCGEKVRLTASDGQALDEFGIAVDLSDSLLIVSAPGGDAAYIFREKNYQWTEEQKLVRPSSASGFFAAGVKGVAIQDNIAIVGDHGNSNIVSSGGCVFSYIYGLTGWSLSKQINHSNISQNDRFGHVVDISGPYTIVSAPDKSNSSGSNAGASYIFCTYSDIITSLSTPKEQILPVKFDLKQNYPNPFNPVTTIVFDLPKAANVTLKIYTILGEEVKTIVSDKLPAGTHKYTWDPISLASGVYLYRIETKEYTLTKKMILMK